MGALATKTQVDRVRENVDLLAKSQDMVFGDLDGFDVTGADKKLGAFFSPVLFRNNDPFHKTDCHDIEAFGKEAPGCLTTLGFVTRRSQDVSRQ